MNLSPTKKFLFSLTLLALLGFFVFGIYRLYKGQVLSARSSRPSKSEASMFSSLSKPETGTPRKLLVQKLQTSVDIISVGKTADGFMETPKQWNQAGWFVESAKTAQIGNIVVNGHYDDNYGKPAAFWKLKTLVVDDKVSIVDSLGRPFTYRITDIYYVAIDAPDRFKVFNSEAGKETLTLITCGGVWLPKEATYNKRLIIKAERID